MNALHCMEGLIGEVRVQELATSMAVGIVTTVKDICPMDSALFERQTVTTSTELQ